MNMMKSYPFHIWIREINFWIFRISGNFHIFRICECLIMFKNTNSKYHMFLLMELEITLFFNLCLAVRGAIIRVFPISNAPWIANVFIKSSIILRFFKCMYVQTSTIITFIMLTQMYRRAPIFCCRTVFIIYWLTNVENVKNTYI